MKTFEEFMEESLSLEIKSPGGKMPIYQNPTKNDLKALKEAYDGNTAGFLADKSKKNVFVWRYV